MKTLINGYFTGKKQEGYHSTVRSKQDEEDGGPLSTAGGDEF